MWPLMFSALIAYIAFAEEPPDSSSYTHDVRMNEPFDFIIRVPVTASFSSSDSGFVECTGITDCGPPNMHVQFFQQRRSLQIYGEPKDRNAKLTIIPLRPALLNISLCIVGTGGDNLPLSCSTSTAFSFNKRDYTDTLTLVFDEDIKEITLEGPITKYAGGTRTGNAEVFIVYEPMDCRAYKLMRVTGRIGPTTISFSLKYPDAVEKTYFIQPLGHVENEYHPIGYITFQKNVDANAR